jgi:hypothetical protein
MPGHFQYRPRRGVRGPGACDCLTDPHRRRHAGAKVVVQLDDVNFAVQWCPICQENRGNGFGGQSEALGGRFTLADYSPPQDWNDGVYPNVVERLPDGRLLVMAGHSIVAATPDGFTGTLRRVDRDLQLAGTDVGVRREPASRDLPVERPSV